jgi:hypothetical protein
MKNSMGDGNPRGITPGFFGQVALHELRQSIPSAIEFGSRMLLSSPSGLILGLKRLHQAKLPCGVASSVWLFALSASGAQSGMSTAVDAIALIVNHCIRFELVQVSC